MSPNDRRSADHESAHLPFEPSQLPDEFVSTCVGDRFADILASSGSTAGPRVHVTKNGLDPSTHGPAPDFQGQGPG
jgi:hypothetical protein